MQTDFLKEYSIQNTDSLNAGIYQQLTDLLDKWPEAGLFMIKRYKGLMHKDCLYAAFFNTVYQKIDSLSNIGFKHPVIDLLNSEKMTHKKAMDFWAQSIDLTVINTTQYRGRYFLIDFWASWCGPCRDKNQEFKKVFPQLQDQGLRMLGVSIDNNRVPWEKAVKKDDLPWDSAWLFDKEKEAEIKKYYDIGAIPMTILLDPDGKLLVINPTFTQIENALNHKN